MSYRVETRRAAWLVAATVALAAGPSPAAAQGPEPVPAPAAKEEPEARAAVPAFRIEAEHEMSSTMYCLRGNTRTGVRTRDGIAAADPRFLPLGSVVRLSLPDGSPLGVFVVMDTGGAVKGNKIDVYVDDCSEAVRWGRRKVVAQVLALGRGGD